MQRINFDTVKGTLLEFGDPKAFEANQSFFHSLYESTFTNSPLGTGFARGRYIMPGVTLSYVSQQYHKTTQLEIGSEDESIAFVFGLSGGADTRIFDFNDALQFYEGYGYFLLMPITSNFLYLPPDITFSSLMLYVEKSTFMGLLGDYLEELPTQLVGELDKQVGYYSRQIKVPAQSALIVKSLTQQNFEGLPGYIQMQGLVQQLIGLQLESLIESFDQSGPRLHSDDIEKVQEAKRFLENNMQEAPTIEELAREVGLSPTKLKAGFKRLFNRSIHQYLMDFRTQQAIMLLESGMGIQDIALQLGYASTSHFSRDFRNRTGQPPSLFQKELPT